jgi:hypothetical protein
MDERSRRWRPLSFLGEHSSRNLKTKTILPTGNAQQMAFRPFEFNRHPETIIRTLRPTLDLTIRL